MGMMTWGVALAIEAEWSVVGFYCLHMRSEYPFPLCHS
jgi:hypothetical protein